MKRKEVIRKLEENGWRLDRHGGNHDIYYNEALKRAIPIKRHAEIDDTTAKKIFKQAGIT